VSPPLHQGTCVAIEGRALLIEGAPGSGKSSLALALIDRGAVLIGDDGVTLEKRGDRLFASPPPRITGLLEVRGLGLIPFATASEIPVALVLLLNPEAERYVEHAGRIVLHGTKLPMVSLWPGTPSLPIKAELALRTFGLA
jgi:serine kinase of HPr protein (carbohydrate metabolism regulator)